MKKRVKFKYYVVVFFVSVIATGSLVILTKLNEDSIIINTAQNMIIRQGSSLT